MSAPPAQAHAQRPGVPTHRHQSGASSAVRPLVPSLAKARQHRVGDAPEKSGQGSRQGGCASRSQARAAVNAQPGRLPTREVSQQEIGGTNGSRRIGPEVQPREANRA